MDCLKMNFYSDNRLPRASDHLGSGASTGLSNHWITYTDGSAIQHLHYLPFGEEQIDQRLTNFNSRYTFSAKEKDIETGYSYFGARYYTSDLSIWLSVDPMSDNTPFATPYAYCINNPIILHDPNGEDWFENENTGGVYFDKDLKNAKTLGEGWKRIGDNDMFGSSANEAIRGNQDLGDIYTMSGDDVGRAEFKGENAEKFMDKMGYKQVSTQVIEYSKSQVQKEWTKAGVISVDIGSTIQIPEKLGYVPKNYSLINSRQIGQGLSITRNGMTESVSRLELSYGKSSFNWISKITSGWSAIFGGNHDYRSIGPPCIPNYNLINKFKNIK